MLQFVKSNLLNSTYLAFTRRTSFMYGPAAPATERCLDDTLAELVQSSVPLADPPPPQQPKHLLKDSNLPDYFEFYKISIQTIF